MMKALLLSVIYIVISYFQVKHLIKKKQKKEAYVFIGLMVLAAYLSIGSILDIYIPNPTNGIRLIFSPIQKWINGLMT